jgi:hypothetical protein
MEFRDLRADEIDCRVATVNQKGLSLLLYKDARVDANILDETVGREFWQRKHEVIGGELFCSIGIYCDMFDGTKQWVWKQDVGVESFTEKEKGRASDAFKRAGFQWSIGRCLYTAPFIWITPDKCNIQPKGDGKYTCYDRFFVEQIIIENKKIVALSIKNRNKKNERVFLWDIRK